MTQYWIIIDEQPSGPYTYEQLATLPRFAPDTQVWYESLTDWIPASQVAALASLFEPQVADECDPVPGMPPIIETPEMPVETPCVEPTGVNVGGTVEEKPARPGNYLVWSILSIVLFFTITGIVALIYSIRVNVNYKRERYQKCVRCSERAQWWIITSIVLACIITPFQLLFI